MKKYSMVMTQSSAGDVVPVAGVVGFRDGNLGKFAHSLNKGKLRDGHFNDDDINSRDNVCSSTHTCGCVVDGSVARTASEEVYTTSSRPRAMQPVV